MSTMTFPDRAILMQLARRNARIVSLVRAGTPVSDAIYQTIVGSPLPPLASKLDNRHADELRAEIADHERFLRQSRARNGVTTNTGPSLAVAFTKHDGRDRQAENARLWGVAIHESAHAIVALYLGLSVESVIARRDGTGLCMVGSARRPTPMEDAAISCAGAQGEHVFGTADTTRMQDHRPECDGPQFSRALGEPEPEPFAMGSDAALSATMRARDIIEGHTLAIAALARVLFDNAGREVPGSSAETIYRFHNGDFDDELDEQATDAALQGREWNLCRGRATGLR